MCQSCFKLLVWTKRLARRPDEHAGLIAELVGSFGRPSEQWTRWLDAQHGTDDVQFSIQSRNTFCNIFSPCQNHRNYAWKLQSLPESQNRAIAERLEIKIASAVNQICRFANCDPAETLRRLPQATHGNRHPKEFAAFVASYADILRPHHAIFFVREEDCVTSPKNVCMGGYSLWGSLLSGVVTFEGSLLSGSKKSYRKLVQQSSFLRNKRQKFVRNSSLINKLTPVQLVTARPWGALGPVPLLTTSRL